MPHARYLLLFFPSPDLSLDPVPSPWPRPPQCAEYFRLYADHFNLWPHIRFNTRVNLVKPAADYDATGRYTATYQEKDKAEVEETFDIVMVCSGHHWKPKTPAFKGLDKFKGTTMHSHSYKDQTGFEDKHVVVVGVGNSGAFPFPPFVLPCSPSDL